MPSGAATCEQLDDPAGVRGVGDEEDVVVAAQVLDEVVDDPAVVGAAHRVLRLARTDPAQVVGEAGVDEVGRPGPGDAGLAEVRDVEDADPLAHRGVLGDDPAAGVLDGHRPAPEVGHLRAERDVSVVERRVEEVGHARHVTACRSGPDASIGCAHDHPVRDHPYPRRAARRHPRRRLGDHPRRRRPRHRARPAAQGRASTSRRSSPTWTPPARPTRWSASSRSPASRRPPSSLTGLGDGHDPPHVVPARPRCAQAAGAALRTVRGKASVAVALPTPDVESLAGRRRRRLRRLLRLRQERSAAGPPCGCRQGPRDGPSAGPERHRRLRRRPGQGRQGRRRPRRRPRRGPRLGPRPRQHPAELPLPRLVRRRREEARVGLGREGHGLGARREGARQGRLRRHRRRRPGVGEPAADRHGVVGAELRQGRRSPSSARGSPSTPAA